MLLLALQTVWTGCPDRQRTAADARPRPDSAPAGPPARSGPRHWFYPSARVALAAIIKRSRPQVIGIGELHHKTDSAPVDSALSRFTREMLDELSGRASDLVVETWVTEGRCGKQEKQVARKVEQSTKRPAETENEVVRLLERAKALRIRPHILTVTCREYEQLLDAKRGNQLDFEKLLDLITRHLHDKTAQLLAVRAKKARSPLVAVYGGALHNDLFPVDELKMFSYGLALQKATRGRYVELDLYVPELVERDEQLKKQAFFPLMGRLGKGQVLLVRRGEGSYILVLRRGLRTRGGGGKTQ